MTEEILHALKLQARLLRLNGWVEQAKEVEKKIMRIKRRTPDTNYPEVSG